MHSVVGCGKIMPCHLRAIAENQTNIVLRAIVDPDPEQREEIKDLDATKQLMKNVQETEAPEESLAEFSSVADLLADKDLMDRVHIVFLAVPHDQHEPLALQVLTHCHDKLLVLEKPMATSRMALDSLVQASQDAWANNKMMMVITEQSPHFEEVDEAKRLIKEGAIGHVITAASYYYQTAKGSYDLTGGLGWRSQKGQMGGGITIDGGLHWIRPLREMLGRIDEVFGVTRTGLTPDLEMEGETLSHALLKFAPAETEGYLTQPSGSGCLVGTFSCNMLATAPMAHDSCPYFRITGTDGEIVIHGDGGLRVYNEENPHGKVIIGQPHKDWFYRGFVHLWSNINRLCLEGRHDIAHENVLYEADDVRVALAIYESAKSGKWEQT
ncbi:hypothetical protein MPSEU_000036700 [Mayamaea pseudoterrestris]|nr:hypothetical protein MPSEU_000036700 [Mayamaea pseudoterrestris]